jgi:hypothetical protein
MKVPSRMLVILGLNERGKPHAARFDTAQAEAVRKAAALMGFRTAVPKTDEAEALTLKLPMGKLFAAGRGLVPLVAGPTYELLAKQLELEPILAGKPASEPPNASAGASRTGSGLQPQSDPWAALKVGDKVVAPEKKPELEGFWPAVVTATSQDGKSLTLRWTVGDSKLPFTVKRRAVALLPR